MKIRQCILTKNDCYIKGTKISKLNGIVVHSTGANNKNIKRYVQPLKTYADYDHIIADIGKNHFGNHWNKGGVSKCVHAFIGVNAKGEVETYQTLPWDVCCWGSGSGNKGSYNYNPTARIQFEICEDNLKDEAYFKAVMKEAQELCAWLCKKYNLSVDHVCSHAEAHKAGFGDNHADIDHWLAKFGKSMDWFRAEVQKLMTVSHFEPFKVRVSIDNLNIRTGPSITHPKTGKFTGKGVFTIVDYALGVGSVTGWGKLKSGAGWISLDYAEKI